MKNLFILILALGMLSSCVSKKKYDELLNTRDEVQLAYDNLRSELDDCNQSLSSTETELRSTENQLAAREAQLATNEQRISTLEKQIDYFQQTNSSLLDRLSDLSVISQTGAESIKQSLESIDERNRYIRELTGKMAAKDSLNLVLVMNLKRSLADVNDEDIQIEVKKGVVYVSLSDKMLFRSGSATILPRAEEVLGKIATVVKDHQQLDILVEGHTDNVPIRNDCMLDNWDLSVKRATSVVRLLQEKHGVRPERMTAGGRSEYIPKATNQTAEGRATNRRTEIIILPKLDEFFQLMEPPTTARD